MITIECTKFNIHTGTYQPHSKQLVTVDEAKKIIEIMKRRISCEGFYRHSFTLENQVFVISTLHVDLKGFMESFKRES